MHLPREHPQILPSGRLQWAHVFLILCYNITYGPPLWGQPQKWESTPQAGYRNQYFTLNSWLNINKTHHHRFELTTISVISIGRNVKKTLFAVSLAFLGSQVNHSQLDRYRSSRGLEDFSSSPLSFLSSCMPDNLLKGDQRAFHMAFIFHLNEEA